MARLPRLVVPNHLHHIIAQGNNDQHIALDDADCLQFLSCLRVSAQLTGVAVHAYVLMPSRVQLMATPTDALGLGKLMQAIGRHYVPYFNARHGRSGNLWEGRYRATVIDAETYFLACAQLIEQQPVAAGIVPDPALYTWSSYAHHSGANREAWLADHPAYWALGNTPFEREAAYHKLAQVSLSTDRIAEIEAATRKAWPLGSEEFLRRLAKLTNRRLEPQRRGRPRRAAASQESQESQANVSAERERSPGQKTG
jgi:putative transposase